MADIIFTEEMNNKLEELLSDVDFSRRVYEAKDAQTIQELFANEGIVIDFETAQATIDQLKKIDEGGELAEEELDLVSGGILGKVLKVSGYIVGGALACASLGGAIALGSAMVCGGIIYDDLKKKKK